MNYDDPDFEEKCNRLLAKLKQDPLFDLRQEYGTMLMRHVDSYSAEEKRRYDELTNLLKTKS